MIILARPVNIPYDHMTIFRTAIQPAGTSTSLPSGCYRAVTTLQQSWPGHCEPDDSIMDNPPLKYSRQLLPAINE